MRSVSSAPSGLVRFLERLLLSGGMLLWGLCAVSLAQVTTALRPDGTLGTAVTRNGNIYTIMGGTRPGNGPNLFHSFDRFSVGTGDTASFTGPQTGITNILSRVTGGQRSDIDGKLRSEIPGANLYLLNPAGVLFGPNASLEVSGSFHVSTADYLRLADGARFFARLSETSTLSVAPPVAFGFLGPTPAAIAVQGSTLAVPEGQTLSAVGGDITITGQGPLTADSVPTLGATGGRIHLASMASAGEVPVNLQEFTGNAVARLGRVALSQGAVIDVSGDGGGVVHIRAGRLLVDGSAILANNLGMRDGTGFGIDLGIKEDTVITNGTFITTDSGGAGRARDLRLTASSVHVDNAVIGSRPFASGDGGIVLVQVGTLTLTGGAQVDNSSSGAGRGGQMTITATDAIAIAGQDSQGSPSGLFSKALASGDAGRVVVSAPTLSLDGGVIQTRADCGSCGNAGDLEVRVGRLTLTGGAQIDSSTLGGGHGGQLIVTATDAITIAGQNSQGDSSGLFSNTLSGTGRAGNLFVSAPHMEMAGGLIQAASGPACPSCPVSRGDAGDIKVEVEKLVLTDGAQIGTFTRGPGQGGNLTVVARDTITVSGEDSQGFQSGLFSNTRGTGKAGQLTVEVGTLVLTGGGVISSATLGPGQAGNLTVVARDTIAITGHSSFNPRRPSGLFSSTDGAGNAGQLTVKAGTLVLTDGAQIGTFTRGPGQGGNLMVVATDTITLAGQSSQGFPSGLFSTTNSASKAGNLAVEAGKLVVTDGARISGSTQGSGQGGTVTVTATDSILIAGRDRTGATPSGLLSQTQGPGTAGNVTVSTPRLTMDNGGHLGVDTGGDGRGGDVIVAVGSLTLSGGAQISSRSGFDVGGTQFIGLGQGGTITVTATDTVAISGPTSGLSTSTMGPGKGGDIALQARQLQLTDGAVIAAESTGTGNAGSVTLTARDTLLLQGHSAVTTAAREATGGNIRVTASSLVRLQDSQITATVGGGTGDGGNVTIDPAFIVLQGSQITANAVAGHGGRVSLTASKALLADPSSTVTASSTLGINGEVNIQAPVTNISGILVPLPQAFARTTALLSTRCAERLQEGNVSSLVVRGRDGVPARPGGVLPLPLSLAPPEAPEAGGTAEPQEDMAASRGGALQVDDHGQAQVRGWPSQGFVPAVLALECTK